MPPLWLRWILARSTVMSLRHDRSKPKRRDQVPTAPSGLAALCVVISLMLAAKIAIHGFATVGQTAPAVISREGAAVVLPPDSRPRERSGVRSQQSLCVRGADTFPSVRGAEWHNVPQPAGNSVRE